MRAPTDEASLEDLLSQPDEETSRALAATDGDIVVLGAGGKMGPTLATMARRALDPTRRVIAVSRFSSDEAAQRLTDRGVEIIRADLSDPAQVRALPVVPNMIWMAGQKFGSSGDPVATWIHNVVASTYAAEHFAGTRIVCFSTGNVYGLSHVDNGGSAESDTLRPDGEYAASCIGRERVFEAIARRTGSTLLLYRLFYACDLRDGVLTDIAVKVHRGEPVARKTGNVNVIWQGDANRLALRSLAIAASPAVALNVTGPIVSTEYLANQLAARLGREPVFEGEPSEYSLVANVTRLQSMLPYVGVPLETLIDWTAEWVREGRPLLGKPTKFEVRDGRF